MLSRVLYIQYAADNTDLGVPAMNIPGGGGMPQFNQEATFWNWLTDPTGGNNLDGAPGRCHLDPILKTRGFLACTTNCANTPTGGNLCAITPYFTASSFPANCGPVSNNGGPAWGYEAVASTAATCCSSNAAPAMVNGVSTCPAVAGLPTNAACSDGPDCLSGVCLADPVGIGIDLCQ